MAPTFQPSHLNSIVAPQAIVTDSLSLEEKERLYEHARNEKVKWHVNLAFIIALWIVAFCFGSLFIFRVAHIIIPQQYCWLSETQLRDIDKWLFGGVFGGFLSGYYKRIVAR